MEPKKAIYFITIIPIGTKWPSKVDKLHEIIWKYEWRKVKVPHN